MPNQAKKIKPEDIQLGTPEMKFYKDIIDGRTQDIKIAKENIEVIKKNIKYFEFVKRCAEEEYKKLEAEFNKTK